MLFALIAYFKPGAEAKAAGLREQFNAHLMQPTPRLRLGGPLCDDEGKRIGLLFVMEAKDRAQVEAFAAGSPHTRADLYDRIEIRRFDVEIGSIN